MEAPRILVELSRRRAIEDVASELFLANGYAATSVRDIARALDIQGASLYAHVTSKEAVLWAIVDRAATRFEAAAAAALTNAPSGDPLAAIAALVRAHVRVITDDAEAAGVFVHEWRALGPERRAEVLARRDTYQRRLRDLVAAGIATGDVAMTDPDIATTAILSALNGIPAWYRPEGRLSADRVADQFVDLILRLLSGASA